MNITEITFTDKEKQFNDMVMYWNDKINIVSRKKENVYDLIEDSRLYLDYIDNDKSKSLLDLGTGGGFPGIVIKIHKPLLNVTLVDSISKKINVVKDIISKLQLNNITAVSSRAEDLGKRSPYKKSFDYITARSVAPLDNLVKWSVNLLKPGGRLITLKGSDINDEIKNARKNLSVDNIDTYEVLNHRSITIVKF
ncbi:MAG: 16S rRNA (guanine(527)-N(7))-methyltransferase RsmG [Ignavibacteriae bacterium]|nr:MAG: 16S rRNA (guanine(527)-N(7))-methyltransferase RsmG [Ignavibacteriota bacterium]